MFFDTGGACSAELDLVFLVDTSGSLSHGDVNKILMFVDHLVKQVGMEHHRTRVGLVTFSEDTNIGFHLEEHLTASALTRGIMGVTYKQGMTNIAAALKVVRTDMFQQSHGDRPGIPNVAVLITDGYSSMNEPETIPQAAMAKENGILLFGVGIDLQDADELNLITGDTDRVFLPFGIDNLMDIAKPLKDAICSGECLDSCQCFRNQVSFASLLNKENKFTVTACNITVEPTL